ncbi:hypothetical protein MSSIT_0189 [Methanosarcina siciliae T4/M]|uniref:Uncharacterized protein n=2 Tax=Methanosarcina siciliae TaxID=38027 RepID=A0A0E3PA05_9EURY|nr:hypothetical protein [Methanosarcina siciliae]AKB26908.1 hypothetical protein MSSIT_0189 [Methanosarcina siciliae T4/M]AKB30875.1 hypothetical protein MSSIH_0185 [Methanosarcina siciliae HI350]
MDQDSIEDYLRDYIDENDKIILEENEVIFLFELKITDIHISAADSFSVSVFRFDIVNIWKMKASYILKNGHALPKVSFLFSFGWL